MPVPADCCCGSKPEHTPKYCLKQTKYIISRLKKSNIVSMCTYMGSTVCSPDPEWIWNLLSVPYSLVSLPSQKVASLDIMPSLPPISLFFGGNFGAIFSSSGENIEGENERLEDGSFNILRNSGVSVLKWPPSGEFIENDIRLPSGLKQSICWPFIIGEPSQCDGDGIERKSWSIQDCQYFRKI